MKTRTPTGPKPTQQPLRSGPAHLLLPSLSHGLSFPHRPSSAHQAPLSPAASTGLAASVRAVIAGVPAPPVGAILYLPSFPSVLTEPAILAVMLARVPNGPHAETPRRPPLNAPLRPPLHSTFRFNTAPNPSSARSPCSTGSGRGGGNARRGWAGAGCWAERCLLDRAGLVQGR